MYYQGSSSPNPNHVNAQNYNNANYQPNPQPVYNQPNAFNPQPGNPVYISQPVYNQQPVYNPQPVYYAQPGSNIPIQQPLVNPPINRPFGLFVRNNSGVILLGCWTITEIIFIFIVLFSSWFGYCYWEFGLTNKQKNVDSGKNYGNNEDSIADFYDHICPDSPYPECPHLCTSLKNVRYSGVIIYSFSSACLALSIITFVIAYLRYRNPNIKFPKFLLVAMNCGSFALYLVGYIVYYTTSKFKENFKNPESHHNIDDPNTFYWSWGLVLSIIIIGVQFFKMISSRVTIENLYVT
ncbi:hypothetical protein SteCoe_16416 [Stentor coeruleus]|uniref:Uncharacterized protein n=1 Tax=Stentor coeruleus TaxID=5963 RepID=A0A1R2C1A7_9CILI|nr:hypothetical protein SteCoe_16416 [Stentor coeruleus]